MIEGEVLVITAVRTANFQEGKAPAAIEWALKVANYINENHGWNVQVTQNVTGMLNQVHWVSTHESLGTLDERGAQLNADAGFQALIAEAAEAQLFVGSSITDALYRSVP